MVVDNVKQATTTTAYANAVKGLSLEQAKLALSTKQLSALEKEQILIKAGLLNATGKLTTGQLTEILTTKERNAEDAKALLLSTGLISAETAEATSVNVVETAKLEELVATKQLTVAEAELIAMKAKVTAANIKEASTTTAVSGKMAGSISILGSSVGSALTKIGSGLLSFASAHPVIAALTTIVGLVGITNSQLKKYEQEQKELIENAKTLQDEYRSFVQSSSNNINSLKAQADEFEELSKGVTKYGENISLSADEYDRYKSIVAEVLGYTPELKESYDKEGTAIANKNSLIERSIELMKEEQRQKLKEMTTDEKTGVAYEGAKAEWDDANAGYEGAHTRNEIARWFENNSTSNGWNYEVDIAKILGIKDEWSDEGNNLQNAIINNIDTVAENIKNKKAELLALEDEKGVALFTEAEIDNMIEKANDWGKAYVEWQQEIEDSKHGMDDQFALYAQRADGYDDLTDAQRAFVNEYIKATGDIVDADGHILSEDEMIEKAESYEKFVDKLATSPEFADTRKKINELFALDSSTIPAGKYEKQVNDILEELQTKFDLTDDEVKDFKIALGFDFIEDGSYTRVSELVEKVQGKLKDDFDDKALDLSLDDLIIASNLGVPEDVELSWEEFIKLLNEAKDIPDEIFSFEEQLSGVESLSKGLDQLADIYKDVQDAGDFDWSSILNNDEFKNTFKDCGKVYDEFIKTVANSPDDIEACQDAFDDLATAYICNSDELKNVTAETKNATVAFLQQKGVTNALQIVEAQLEAQRIKSTMAIDDLKDATYEQITATYGEIPALLAEANASDTTRAALFNLITASETFNSTKLSMTQKLKALEELAVSFGIVSDAAKTATRSMAIETQIEILRNSGGFNEGQLRTIQSQMTEFAYHEAEREFRARFGNIVDYSGGGGTGSGGGSSSKDTEEKIDWIETLLSRLQRTVENLGKTVSATYLTWSTRNNALLSEISAVNEELVVQQKVYQKYMDLANSVGLSDHYKELVQNGTFDVETITDETLKKQIALYKEYYEKALECSDAIQDLTESLAELAKQKFDNISTKFDNIMSTTTSQMDIINAYIELAEEKGHLVSTGYYETLKELEQKNKESLQSEYNALQQALSEAIASGAIQEGSEDWYEMMDAIAEVKKEIIEADIALQEYENTIRELEWEVFDKMQEAMSQVTEEADFLMELMGNDKMHDENGNLTDEGQAVMGLHAMNYNAYMAQADEYGRELAKINEELANDPNNQELLERRQELLEQQREMILAAEDEKQAMLDLIREGYDAMLASMEELIQKKKEMFKEITDMRDFEKNIKDQVAELDKLRKQLLAYQGDDSEGSKATIQQLEEKIREAEENLEQTEYDKYISDMEKLLDVIYSETEAWINERMDAEAELLQQIIDETNANADEIKEVLEGQAEDVGMKLSDALSSIWTTDGGVKDVVSMYGNTISGQMTTVATILQSIKDAIAAMVTESDEVAEDDIDDSTPKEPENPAPLEPPVTPEDPKPEDPKPDEPSKEWGHWFIPKKNQVPDSKLQKNSSIVDRLKSLDYDSSMSARAKYYKAMGGSGKYTGSSSQNRWMLQEMKSHGFAKGGTIGSLIKSTGEDGFVLARTGEEILSLDKIKELGFTFEKMKPIVDTMKCLPNVQSNVLNRNMDINVNVGDIQMYGVNDPEQFAIQLKGAINNNSSVRKMLNDVTLGEALGHNTLTRYRR